MQIPISWSGGWVRLAFCLRLAAPLPSALSSLFAVLQINNVHIQRPSQDWMKNLHAITHDPGATHKFGASRLPPHAAFWFAYLRAGLPTRLQGWNAICPAA